MKQQDKESIRQKKKELNTILADTIEKTLELDKREEKFKKLRKKIKQTAKQITKKYLEKLKDHQNKKRVAINKKAMKKADNTPRLTRDRYKEINNSKDEFSL